MSNKNVIWADQKDLSKDLSGKTYIVTGANSGVGFETTQQLVKQGAHVVMACRRTSAGEEKAKDFKELKGSCEVIKCDLADLQSVREFVTDFKKGNEHLHGLVCNAGMVNMENKPVYTKDGFEITWAASFFGHFLLVELLLDTLKSSAPSRVAILSSVVHAGNPKKRHFVHYYDRQFYTRTSFNKDFVSSFERHLKDYFAKEKPLEFGVPVVKYFCDKLNMSANYLSDMLKKETGLSAKGHINKMLVDKAKSALLNSDEPVSQIAYSLGFEHPQSLTSLFKAKTGVSPNKYRYAN